MINLKIILLLLGIFLFILGFINNYKKMIIKKTVYKFVPRNVYDEIFFSIPVQYNESLDEKINPSYVLYGNKKFNDLYIDENDKYNKYTAYDVVNPLINPGSDMVNDSNMNISDILNN